MVSADSLNQLRHVVETDTHSRIPRYLAVLVLTLVASLRLLGQPARVTGQIIDAVSSAPVAGATIGAQWCDPVTSVTPTKSDPDGRFIFNDLTDDQLCSLSVERDGYLAGTVGSGTGGPLKISLVPEAVITGQIINERGEALGGVQVALGTREVFIGHARVSEKYSYRTDDQGRFRISNLTAGSYLVCALPDVNAPRKDDRTFIPVTCHPGSSERNKAEWIDLKAGESRALQIQVIPRQGAKLSVRVTNSERSMGNWIEEASQVFLVNRGFSLGATKWNWMTGEFQYSGMPPGKYWVEMFSGDNQRRAAALVEVGSEDIRDVELTLRPIPLLVGKFRTDDGSPLPDLKDFGALVLFPASEVFSRWGATPVNATGSFQASIAIPQPYQLAISDRFLPSPWHVKSAIQAGRDVLTENIVTGPGDPRPIEIVLTRQAGRLEGTVKDAGGSEELTAVVLLRRFGTRVRWVNYLRPPFRLDNLTVGKYLMFAWPERCNVPYLDPDFLEHYGRYGKDVEVQSGFPAQVDLERIPTCPVTKP